MAHDVLPPKPPPARPGPVMPPPAPTRPPTHGTCRMEEFLIITPSPRKDKRRLKETRYRVYRTPKSELQEHDTVRLVKVVQNPDLGRPGIVVPDDKVWVPTRHVYDISLTEWGPVCDCPDFLYTRDGIDEGGCKHVRAAVAQALIPPPEPVDRSRNV